MNSTPSQPDQETCHRLVGAFLQLWAAMELQLDNAISQALGVQGIQAYIVCANIQFRDKINILRTAVDVSRLPQSRTTAYDKLLIKLSRFANDRNIVVHVPFVATDDGKGVIFMKTQAKGKLAFPEIIWKDNDFQQKYGKIIRFKRVLSTLEKDLQRSDIRTLLAKALLSPTSNTFPPGLLGLPLSPAQAHQNLDTDLSTSEITDETPASSGEEEQSS